VGDPERRRPRNLSRPLPPRYPQSEVVAGAENTVDGLLRVMDDQVRRWGRVDREQVQQVLDLLNNAGPGLSL